MAGYNRTPGISLVEGTGEGVTQEDLDGAIGTVNTELATKAPTSAVDAVAADVADLETATNTALDGKIDVETHPTQPTNASLERVYLINKYSAVALNGTNDNAQAVQDAFDEMIADGVAGKLRWYGKLRIASPVTMYVQPGGVIDFGGHGGQDTLTLDGTALAGSPAIRGNTDTDTQPTDVDDDPFNPRQPRHWFHHFRLLSSGGGGMLANIWQTGAKFESIEAIDVDGIATRVGSAGHFADGWQFEDIKLVSTRPDAAICTATSGTGDGYRFTNCSASGGMNGGGAYIAKLTGGHAHKFFNCVGGSIVLNDCHGVVIDADYGDSNSVYHSSGADSAGEPAYMFVDCDVTVMQVNRLTKGNSTVDFSAGSRVQATFEIADTASGTKGGRYHFMDCQPTAVIRDSFSLPNRPYDLWITSLNPDSVVTWENGYGRIWKDESTTTFAGYPVKFGASQAAVATALSVGMDRLGGNWQLRKTQGSWLVGGIGLASSIQSLRAMTKPTVTVTPDTDYQTSDLTIGNTYYYRVWLVRGELPTEATASVSGLVGTSDDPPGALGTGPTPLRLNILATASTDNELPRCKIVVMRATTTDMTTNPKYVELPWHGGDLVLYDVGSRCGGYTWVTGTPTGGIPDANATMDGRENLVTRRKELYGSVVPATATHKFGTYRAGDIVWYTAPVAGGPLGAACVTGNTVGTNAGTWEEFGWQDGRLLAYVNYLHAGTTTTSATFADIDSTNLTVTFTAPASGRVIVEMSLPLATSAAGSPVQLNLRDSVAGDIANTDYNRAAVPTNCVRSFYKMRLNLTAGTTYTIRPGWKIAGGQTATLFSDRCVIEVIAAS